jgi:uncharacterized protein
VSDSSTNLAAQATDTACDLTAQISQLWVYPVKSCAGVQVQEALLTETGLEFDRAWMVVDAQGQFLTQRELPHMALVRPQLKHFEMVLRAPGMLALHIALDRVEAPVRVRVWDDEVAAYDMGAIAAQWFSDFLGVPARLVRFAPEHQRLSSREWTGVVDALNQFTDSYPLMAISEASLANLNDKLLAGGAAAVSVARFRPNIVLGDSAMSVEAMSPHDEDRLDELQVATPQGLVRLKPVKPCSRCPMVNIDPLTAASNTAVSDLLQGYRQDARLQGALTFGMNLITLQGTEHLLKVGQVVKANYRFD